MEISLNSTMDTMELLGGFEQIDVVRHLKEIREDVFDVVMSILRGLVLRSACVGEKMDIEEDLAAGGSAVSDAQELYDLWAMSALRARFRNKRGSSGSDSGSSADVVKAHLEVVTDLSSVLRKCRELCRRESHGQLLQRLAELESEVAKLQELAASSTAGRFEWLNGLVASN